MLRMQSRATSCRPCSVHFAWSRGVGSTGTWYFRLVYMTTVQSILWWTCFGRGCWQTSVPVSWFTRSAVRAKWTRWPLRVTIYTAWPAETTCPANNGHGTTLTPATTLAGDSVYNSLSMSSLFAQKFIETRIVTTITRERLEQSRWNLQGIFWWPYWWPDYILEVESQRSRSRQTVKVAKASTSTLRLSIVNYYKS